MIASVYSTRVVNTVPLSKHYQEICVHRHLTEMIWRVEKNEIYRGLAISGIAKVTYDHV